ncbi:MAG TPA: hypothetical protein GXZ61_06700 [Clostridiales bacterium]|jgi:YbbR domain-containing protein|nr:hypothetical protein [Clostridiales bacterium]
MSNRGKIQLNNRLPKFIKNNLFIIIVSFITAFVLWGFVLASQNPERTKTLTGIKVTFEGEADLIARSLVIVGDRSTILPDATVYVSADLLHYANLNNSKVTATVSLRSITGEGMHTLDIRATTSNGTILKVVPSTVTIQVDRLTTKRVPIQVEYDGELSQNYWHSEPVLSKTDVEIKGAYSILSSITSAICKIPLATRTESFSNAISLSLVDSNGHLVNSNLLYGDLPSVTVSLTILPKKTVMLDVINSLIGADALKTNYEVYYITVSPATVTIIGEKAILDSISRIHLEHLDITGASKSLERELKLVIPEGVTVLEDIKTATAYITIQEKVISKTFESIPISVKNLGRGFDYTLSTTSATITISGRISVINKINRGDIELYVDLKGLKAPYTGVLPISVDLGSSSLLNEVTVTLDATSVTVTISEK